MSRETVIEETKEGVRTLVMNRPEARNAFDNRLYRDMREAFAAAAADDEIRVVIVTGAPGAFTAGQDLSQMTAGTNGEAPGFPSFMEELIAFDKPLIAAVNGVGVGLGLTLLLHCDVVYIARGARLKTPFVSLGVVPEAASSYLLPYYVGPQRAAEIFFTADWVTSDQAVDMGLAARELEPDELLPAAEELASRIAIHPVGALRATKRVVRAAHLDAVKAARKREDATFAERIGSPENIEAITAFFEKRKPDFSKVSSS